ncbi:MAG: glycosyltransferase, partial [Thermodesulfobacteriota bacterium]|nr:glycosyltransferase [Thermodesulfobacteriota bacterium]
FDVPLVISPRGMLEPWARSYRSFKKTIAWYLYQRRDLQAAAVLHATSQQEAENLQALGLSIPIAVIPNGVDLPDIPVPGTRKSKTKTALFLSRVHPIKGLVNLVQAWATIRPAGWQMLIAGPDEGGHQAEVEQEIIRQGLTDTFKFIGPVADEDKWELYRSSDLFVLPTFSENFGIVIAEALASEVPVITTRGTPWQELETHNCGWWVDIGVEPLAKALEETINLSPEERQAMGRRGRLLVAQNYSWDKIGQEMVAVYEWVLRGGEVPECVVTD